MEPSLTSVAHFRAYPCFHQTSCLGCSAVADQNTNSKQRKCSDRSTEQRESTGNITAAGVLFQIHPQENNSQVGKKNV